MKKQRLQLIPIKKVEDTVSLRWARVANRGEEKRAAHEIKIIQRATALNCCDVEREKKALERVLEKVKTSTGYLDKDMHKKRT